MTIQEILHKTYSKYELSPLDSGILLSLAIGKPKEYIIAHPEKKLSRFQIKKFLALAKRRFSGEPIAYIIGKKEFYGLDFLVNKNVLIPRPETELLVDTVIKKILDTKYQIPDTIIDIGAGSGNIIISIAKNIPGKLKNKINYFAIDNSKGALKVARANAKLHKVDKKIKFVQSDMLEYFLKKNKLRIRNLFVVANLPYVSPALYKKNKSNLEYEPESALVSGKKGLDHYARLIREIGEMGEKYCMLRVVCYAEISPEQKAEIRLIFGKFFPRAQTIFLRDLAGKWRLAAIEIIRP